MNLYEEIVEKLKENDKTLKDIVWVGGKDFSIPLDHFLELAKETGYYDGFGGQEIAKDLLIVGGDWWLEREEYDGSEWFTFKTPPKKPDLEYKARNLSVKQAENDKRIDKWICGWCTLMELNSKEMFSSEVLEDGK